MKKEYTLVPMKEEEGKEAVKKLQKFLLDNDLELVCGPIITPQGTLGADIKIFRRVELMGVAEDGKKFIGDEGEEKTS